MFFAKDLCFLPVYYVVSPGYMIRYCRLSLFLFRGSTLSNISVVAVFTPDPVDDITTLEFFPLVLSTYLLSHVYNPLIKRSNAGKETNSHQKSISQHAGSDGHSDEVSRRSETKY